MEDLMSVADIPKVQIQKDMVFNYVNKNFIGKNASLNNFVFLGFCGDFTKNDHFEAVSNRFRITNLHTVSNAMQNIDSAENYVCLFDASKPSENFRDNLCFVAVCDLPSFIFPYLSKDTDCVNGESYLNMYCGYMVDDSDFVNADENVYRQKTYHEYRFSVLNRAKMITQILSAFDFEKATKQEQNIMMVLRENAMDMLQTAETRKLQNLVKHDVAPTKDIAGYAKTKVLIKQLALHRKNDSLSEYIEFCESKVERSIEETRNKNEQKAQNKANNKEEKKREKKVERYKI